MSNYIEELEKQNDELQHELGRLQYYVEFIRKHLRYKTQYDYSIKIDFHPTETKDSAYDYDNTTSNTIILHKEDFRCILKRFNYLVGVKASCNYFIDTIQNMHTIELHKGKTGSYLFSLYLTGTRPSFVTGMPESFLRDFTFKVDEDGPPQKLLYRHHNFAGWAL